MFGSENVPFIEIAPNDYINPEHIERAYIEGGALYLHLVSGRGRVVNLSDPHFPAIAEEVQSVIRRKFVFEQEEVKEQEGTN